MVALRAMMQAILYFRMHGQLLPRQICGKLHHAILQHERFTETGKLIGICFRKELANLSTTSRVNMVGEGRPCLKKIGAGSAYRRAFHPGSDPTLTVVAAVEFLPYVVLSCPPRNASCIDVTVRLPV